MPAEHWPLQPIMQGAATLQQVQMQLVSMRAGLQDDAVGIQWVYSGYTVGMQVGVQWVYYGYTVGMQVGVQWVHSAGTMGRSRAVAGQMTHQKLSHTDQPQRHRQPDRKLQP